MLAHSPRQYALVAAAACLLVAPHTSHAQVVRVAPAVRLAKLSSEGATFRYEYELVGLARERETIADFYIDLRSPKTPRRPVVTGTRGEFLFDALAEMHEQADVSHPPVFIATPQNWSAAIYIYGVLSWGANRWAGGANHGVPAGRRLAGFELHSNALPALRRYNAVPYRPLPSVDAPPASTERVDSTFVLMTGFVLAPGWPADIVSGEFLDEQLKVICEQRLIASCGPHLRALDRLKAAESSRDDAVYRAALAELRAALERGEVHSNARAVLSNAIAALERRPPSIRAAR
jgi:hypothetical protein